MKKTDIKRHLQDYSIFQKRATTINHAFASAISIADNYNEEKLNAALLILGQDPNGILLCAYCDKAAETWDHIKAVVVKGEFSGYGHILNNLIPCCKHCNSSKGNKDWKQYLEKEGLNTPDRIKRIEKYISQHNTDLLNILNIVCEDEMKELDKIKKQVIELLKQGDKQAIIIRNKAKKKLGIPIFFTDLLQ
jgi:5-methylcytosine-specific restriction endonuclease McrA